MQAWVTLATNNQYAIGAVVLAQSLRDAGTSKKLHCLITNTLSEQARLDIESIFDEVTVVDPLHSGDEENLALIGRPDLGVTFTKLHCWRLTQYEKCVFLDADTLVLRNCDELFDRDICFAAVADTGWPDMFNTGVFFFRPSLDTYRRLLSFATVHGSYDGGDQGLLNDFFSNWSLSGTEVRLSFVYNVAVCALYSSYMAAWKRFGHSVKIVHFLGRQKPWNSADVGDTVISYHPQQDQFNKIWWRVYHEFKRASEESTSLPNSSTIPSAPRPTVAEPFYVPKQGQIDKLSSPLSQLRKAVANPEKLSADESTSIPSDDTSRRRAWESGHPDYLGMDSFANIQNKIDGHM